MSHGVVVAYVYQAESRWQYQGMNGRRRQQTAYVLYQGRRYFSNCQHIICSTNKHCWHQGKQGCHSHWHPQRVHSEACRIEKGHGDNQAMRILGEYPMCNFFRLQGLYN